MSTFLLIGSSLTSLILFCAVSVNAQPDLNRLKLLYWQAPTILNPHLATGVKDAEAARIVYEPLATLMADGQLIPILAADIPSLDNGLLSDDYRSVIWPLKTGVQWSDGEPFTADDVVFTYEYITDPTVGAFTAAAYASIESVEALDATTVKITFAQPTSNWTDPFVGGLGLILPAHQFQDSLDKDPQSAAANLKPVGTGPYVVTDFKPGDVVLYAANPFFREADKPYFQEVELKGGGEPLTAAQAVVQTGDADYAWNIQVEAALLDTLNTEQGTIQSNLSSQIERILFNFSDPNLVVDGERSHRSTQHPFFSDRRVRQAFNFAIDRDTIATEIYGGAATTDLIAFPLELRSITPHSFDLEQARILLDETGWVDTNGDGIRDQQGIEMTVLFQTSTNSLRQQVQQVIKQDLAQIGVNVELKAVESSIFFSGDPANADNVGHFYADLQMFTTGNRSPDPTSYLKRYTCAEIAQQANNWLSPNFSRYCNPDVDALFNTLMQTTDPDERRRLILEINDHLVSKDFAVMPLVIRSLPAAVSNDLQGLNPTPWDLDLWNIQDWRREDP